MRGSNSAVAQGVSVTSPNAVTWATFDALPRLMRRALWEAPVSVNPASAADLIAEYGLIGALEALREAIRAEVRQFAVQHLVRHGYALPHVAAEASFQPFAQPICATRRRG